VSAANELRGNEKAAASPAFWRDRPVFVTGATGLLGGAIVRHLVDAGADVVCLVRDWVPRSEMVASGLIDRVGVVRGDVTDQDTIERALGEYDVVTVLHLAAQAIVGVANRNPLSTFESNVRGTWVMLEACRRSPLVRQIIVASSDKAYGDHDVLPYTEDAPVLGQHPYDVSKSCADLIARSYAKSFGLPVCVTRCGNFYGGGDLNWNRLVPGTIRSVLRNERPVIRSDGKYIRDYIYVDDGSRAYTLLAEQLGARPELAGEVFNFSYERQMDVMALVQAILRAMGSTLTPDVRNEATNEIRNQYLDASKAKAVLGWKPAYTLEESLGATIDWYRRYFNA
jgi:CDP-glucose 4,6-dehydratase